MTLETKKTAKTPNKLTLDDLIKRAPALKKKTKETKAVYVESLKGTVIVEEPDRETVMDSLDYNDNYSGDRYLVYSSVISPNLKDSSLQEAYECVSPDEIIDKLFKVGEISAIAKIAIELAGYNNLTKVVDDLKN